MKISIILPTYNRGYVLRDAVHSVLCQTYTDFELLVIDDGSNDGTADIIAGYSDHRVHLIRHSTNLGVSAALNTGLENAKGEVVAFLDSDDLWTADKLDA